MKKIYLLAALILGLINVQAQDTLKSADLPNVNDIYVLSLVNTFAGFTATSTGPNYTWDFSALGRNSQRIDTMVNPANTDPLLSFFFINVGINSNRSNHAVRGANFNLGVVGLSDVYNYFYNSSSDYQQAGFGGVVSGVPIPVAYDPHDVPYRFPLKYNDEDSVAFGYELDLTTTVGLFFKVTKKRHNLVDGWGMVTTPFGTFSALRVKSTLVERDSVFIDSLNLGVNLPAVTTKEYKWLSPTHGLPILQINTSATDQITQILYQDSIHLTGIEEVNVFENDIVVYPNPARENIFIRYTLTKKEPVTFEFYNMEGKLIFSLSEVNSLQGDNFKVINLSEYKLANGNYIMKLKSGNNVIMKPIQIR